ncbi:MAG TPA: hypothetical protein VG406_25750 [Isosphaeraceae bacterium]|jgi:hypothetical protein|nr:hypothetical protein [Isosphaeraceae bacterium]
MRPIRRRWTISLRVLMLLVLLSAVGLARVTNRAKAMRRAVAEIKRHGGDVVYDYEFADGNEIPDGKPRAPEWLRRQLGDDYFQDVTCVGYSNHPISDDTLVPLRMLGRIEALAFQRTCIPTDEPDVHDSNEHDRLTEAGLASLGTLTRLRELSIDRQPLAGSVLHRLDHSTQMESLRLAYTGLTDAGMPRANASNSQILVCKELATS